MVRGVLRKDIMDEIVMQAELREVVGKKVKRLRRDGKLPAVIYGKEMQPIPISLQTQSAVKILSKATSSSLISLNVGDSMFTTVVRDRQIDPVSGQLLHVDFLGVSLTEKLRTYVNLQLIGESPAAKSQGGLIVMNLEQVEIEAYPKDLMDYFEVDISILEEIGSSLFVRDLVVPDEVEVLTHPDEIIVVVTSPAMEVEPVEVEEEIETEEPVLIERSKDDDFEDN